MSMYSEILAHALDEEAAAPARPTRELLEAVEVRRVAVLESRALPAEDRVACELAYDVAIMRLCAAVGIDVTAGHFSHPASERVKLVRSLARVGMVSGARGPTSRVPASRVPL